MRRREDWPERLAAVVKGALDVPFAWGRNDCALFACDCAEAMCDEDPAAAYRGKYKSARGALAALKRIGGVASIEGLANAVLGAPIEVAEARRGDVVLVETRVADARWPALGVVIGGGRVASVGERGVEFLSRADATRAWRVG